MGEEGIHIKDLAPSIYQNKELAPSIHPNEDLAPSIHTNKELVPGIHKLPQATGFNVLVYYVSDIAR